MSGVRIDTVTYSVRQAWLAGEVIGLPGTVQ